MPLRRLRQPGNHLLFCTVPLPTPTIAATLSMPYPAMRRQGHTEGGGAGWRRERHRAAGKEGDGCDNGGSGVTVVETVGDQQPAAQLSDRAASVSEHLARQRDDEFSERIDLAFD